MADTVKKSRIVSDEDNLEESLLEEFNMRLKNCMSQDDLQKEPPDENHKPQITQMFLQNEIENHYDEPRLLKNGHQEQLYEVIAEKTETDQKYIPMNLYESMQPPTLNLPVEDKTPDAEPTTTSVKNRMLLSCDETSTLLFTQTVTSPMLTPSEENIDFLKGFQKEGSPEENYYENTEFYKNTTPENTYENVVVGTKEEDKEDIYENVEICKDESLEEFIRYEAEADNAVELALPTETDNVVDDEADAAEDEAAAADVTEADTAAVDDEPDCTAVVENGHDLKLETYKELIHHHRSEVTSNYYEKYTETLKKTDLLCNKEKDTETVPAEIVKNLKSQFQNNKVEVVGIVKKNVEPKSVIINQIRTKFEVNDDSSEYTETIVETSGAGEKSIKKKKVKKTRKEEKENISVHQNGNVGGFYNVNVKSLKSSFSKFDALQKKNVLHVRSSDSTKAQEKFSNGNAIEQASNCKSCGKQVFQMEQIKAERALWHKNCFRCSECSKQLTVDTYESNDGCLYCKPHFKALFAPKAVEEDASPKPRRNELIIRESQPVELPPDVVRAIPKRNEDEASDKPDLGLEELQSLNVKQRFQVFEQYQQHTETSELERGVQNVKRSPSILSKLAKFQKHGMDIGVSNEALDGIPIEESDSDEEEEEDIPEGEDADLVRAKRVQKEKPFHFTGMSDVKKRWEQGDHAREERREETKQEIQNIRTKLFMGKQEKMKEAYQQAVMESESSSNLRKNSDKIDCDTRSIKERFEKGEVAYEKADRDEEEEVYESEISKKSRSLFLELDASASKPPQLSPVTPPRLEVKKAREAYLEKSSKEDTVKSTEQVDEVEVKTADIQERFKFFETYKEPQKLKKQFRITPPRDPQVKSGSPEPEIQRDPDVIRSEEYIDDSTIAKESHTASKMLNKFRQMEENLSREPELQGPKPLKRFTPPPEPARSESRSEEESEYEEEEEEEVETAGKLPEDVIEAQKAARAKQLRAKFEKWEANEIKKEQQSAVSIVEEFGEEQKQIESTRVLRARFEQMRETTSETSQKTTRVKPNRFVEIPAAVMESCQSCNERVYPLEKITVHGHIYHKGCFKCMECSCVLRMDTYCYNQGLLYCTPHFKRVFISKGNYDSAFGLDQHKEKWVNNMTVA